MKKMRKGAGRILALLLSFMVIAGMLPEAAPTVLANEHSGQVHVIVENTTYTSKTAPWQGKLVDEWVELEADSTMMSCIVDALGDHSQTGADSGYISEVNGLEASDENAGRMSGWMGTLNDWFVNEGFDAFTAAKGTLAAGDEIRLMYSCDGGEDLGSSWSSTDKTVKSLSFSEGALTPAFSKDAHAYTLTVGADVTGVMVTPTASNKNYQVRTSVNGKEYKRTESVPVTDGTVITVKCGDPSWPSMNDNSGEAQTYTVTVKQEKAPSIKVSIRSQMEGGYLHGLEQVSVSAGTAEKYGYSDSVDGVSALDALVKAHELVFGDAFTKETAGEYLEVGSSGWISVIFGVETYASGFYVNQGYPNDGTPAISGGGYNGTFVTNTPIADGDELDFYVMSDSDYYSDYYTWVEAPDEMMAGDQITVTVKGFFAMEGYRYKDPASLKEAAKALEGVQLAWVDLASGATTDITGAVTDENGEATFTVTEGATGYLVAKSYGDAEEDERVYTIMNPSEKVQEIPVQTVDLKGLHSAQLNSLKLYTYTGGVKGTTDLLADKSTVADGYQLQYAAVKLPVGDYWVEGYDANNDYNGGMVVSVKEDTTAITVHRAYEIYASNSGWVQGTDYTIDYQVTGADGVNRKAEMGTANYLGNIRASGLFQDLDTIKVTLTPIGSRAEEYVAATVTKTGANVTGTNLGISANIPKAIAATVTAPAGSEVSMGTFGSYYSYEFLEAESTKTEGGTLTASFRLPETSANHFLRVQHPDGVTYWSFGKWKAGQSFTVTKEDLHIGDKEFAKDTVYRFDKNKYDRADIYLNINSKGYMNMDVGQTFELNVFRNWMAIESFVNAQVALPDMHYQVVDFEGRPSDVVTVTPDKNNSSLSTLKANKEGTAIVLVTYDAMTHMQGMSSTDSKAFSAIWPECTGVFVVSVGADGSAIQTNMVMDRMGATISKPEQNDIDAEHDILFYLGDEGAEYTFTPENGCTVTVARSTVEDSAMSFDGFTSEGVITDAGTGAVTVTNLTSGRHIVRVEKDGVATYQVITARGVRYDLLDADGKILPANTEFKAGDKVKVQFHNLVSPKEKLSGVYNFNFSLSYQGEDDSSFTSNPGSAFGVYDFSGNPERQQIEITIPEDWTELSYDLTGAIKVGGFGGAPTHRGVSYTKGMGMQTGTSTAGVLSRLPELSLKLEGWAVNDAEQKIAAIGTVTLDSEGAIQAARTAYDALTDEQKKQVGNYDVLVAAEALLSNLKAAGEVENKIDAIGTVTLASEEAIQAARDAYDALTAAQKELVKNYGVLTAAEEKLAQLQDEAARAAFAEEVYKTTGDYLAGLDTPTVGSIGGEWAVLGLARSGRSVPEGYYENVVKYVQENIDGNERLHRTKSTENSRVILALTAMGKDVTNVGGHNLLAGLDEMAYIQKQGINGSIWALIALDSHDYAASGDVTRDKLVQAILDSELAGGGWALNGDAADVDMTAMAIQALAPYYKTKDAVKTTVDRALELLSTMQLATGGFGSWGSENSESCAQVIVALTSLGINPTADARFIKGGLNPVDALCDYYVAGGGFSHTADGEGRSGMATEQGYYALAAYYRLLNGQTSLYDMSDVTIKENPNPSNPSKPGEPDEPDENNGGDGTAEPPKTGESSYVLLWLATSMFALTALAVLGKRKKQLR